MWTIKTFKTEEAMELWLQKNNHKIQYERIFINNGWGIEYRKLRRVY